MSTPDFAASTGIEPHSASTVLQRRRDLERHELLIAIQALTALPMALLSLLMLVLLIIQFTVHLTRTENRWITLANWLIWAAFVAEFFLNFSLAPRKTEYLRENWLTVLSLVLPALRVFRLVEAIRALPSLNAFRTVALANRNLRKLALLFPHRRFAYLVACTFIVVFGGAAAEFAVESTHPGANIVTYGGALWWAIGAITTEGSELYPVTGPGRFVAVLMMLYGISAFSMVAGSLATYFVHVKADEEKEREEHQSHDIESNLQALHELEGRVAALRTAFQTKTVPALAATAPSHRTQSGPDGPAP